MTSIRTYLLKIQDKSKAGYTQRFGHAAAPKKSAEMRVNWRLLHFVRKNITEF
jgi:hypothetical protein